MIDVDVVKDIDQTYAQDVHGVSESLIDCFVLGIKSEGSEDISLPVAKRNGNMAVSFTQSLGDFLYEFAEQHYLCDEGDEILLLTIKVDGTGLVSDELHKVLASSAESALQSDRAVIIKRRLAIGSESKELRKKVVDDIYSWKQRMNLSSGDGPERYSLSQAV